MKRLWIVAATALALGLCGGCSGGDPESGTSKTSANVDDTSAADVPVTDSGGADKACDCDTANDSVCSVNTCDTATGKCAMQPRNNGAPCVDDDPCSPDDKCENGTCKAGKANLCTCKTSADCKGQEDGDLCNGTLFCNLSLFPYRCAVKPSTVIHCKGIDEPCSITTCEPKNGTCESVDKPDGLACDDGNKCTQSETCTAGKCSGGANTCACQTNADCDPLDDSNACNGGLYCDKATKPAKCAVNKASIVKCPPSKAGSCTVLACDAKSGLCTPKAAPTSTVCDDNDACTTKDHCLGGVCQGGSFTCTCKTTADCAKFDDGDKCNGTLYCDKVAGKCAPNPASLITCSVVKDSACAKSVCNAATGKCELRARADVKEVCKPDTTKVGSPIACTFAAKKKGESAGEGPFLCDDANACSSGDVCEGKTCKAAAITCKCTTNADCAKADDGDLCNGVYYCNKSLKVADCTFNPASKVFCSKKDDTVCLKVACDPKTGKCGMRPQKLGLACDDGSKCTTSTACDATGQCSGKALKCDDKDVCTLDVCHPLKGCTHESSNCKDGNDCTVDACDSKTGSCSFDHSKSVGTVCNADNTGCTVNDRCDTNGKCIAGPKVVCDVKVKQCQQVQCVTQGLHGFTCAPLATPDGGKCDDGDDCTLASVCVGGKCDGSAFEAYFYRRPTLDAIMHTNPKYKAIKGLTGSFESVAVLQGGIVGMGGVASTGKGATKVNYAAVAVLDKTAKVLGGALLPLKSASADVPDMITQSGITVTVIINKAPANGDASIMLFGGDLVKTSWQADLKPAAGGERGEGLVGHSDGGVTIVGRTLAAGGKALVRRTTVFGAAKWTRVINTATASNLNAVIRDGKSHLFAAGSIQVGKGLAARTQAWIARMDDAGKVLWQRTYAGKTNRAITAMTRLASGRLIAIGQESAPIPKAPIHGSFMAFSSLGDPAGSVTSPIPSRFTAIAKRASGHLAVVGSINSPITPNSLYLVGADTLGNPTWARAPTKGGLKERLLDVAIDPTGALWVVGQSRKKNGTTQPIYGRTNPWGDASCKEAGKCLGKKHGACDDGVACTIDMCDGDTGCSNKSYSGVLCKPGGDCITIGQCKGKTCLPLPRTKLFGRTVKANMSAVASIAPLAGGGMLLAGRTGDFDNAFARLDAVGDVMASATLPAKPPSGTTKPGLGAIRTGSLKDGRYWLLGHSAKATQYPVLHLWWLDVAGGAAQTFRALETADSIGHDAATRHNGTDVLLAYWANSMRVAAVSAAGKELWRTDPILSDAPNGVARLVPSETGGAIIAAALTAASGPAEDLLIGHVTSTGKLASVKTVPTASDLEVTGLVAAGKDVIATGMHTVGGRVMSWTARVSVDGKIAWQRIGRLQPKGAIYGGAALVPGGLVIGHRADPGKVGRLGAVSISSFGGVAQPLPFTAAGLSLSLGVHSPVASWLDGGYAIAGMAHDGTKNHPFVVRAAPFGHTTCGTDGKCAGKKSDSCDDQKPCTVDRCDPKVGCVHTPAKNGLLCGPANTCIKGSCVANPAGMVYVPAGSFYMGCNAALDKHCSAEELPQHEVVLSKGYWIDKYEVSLDEMRACVQANVCVGPSMGISTIGNCNKYHTPVTAKGKDAPVQCVHPKAMAKYCAWKNKRLPTEAEWSKAARGGCEIWGADCAKKTPTYAWGEDEPVCGTKEYIHRGKAPHSGWACGTAWVGHRGKHPADQSVYGVFDMTGSVSEFTADRYDNKYYAKSPKTDPQGPSSGSASSIRGGNFKRSQTGDLRLAAREGKSIGNEMYGFRCVMTAK